MSTRSISIACLVPALIAAASLPTPASSTDELGPPSLIKVPKGRTFIGTSPKEIQEMIEENESAKNALRSLDAETPQKREDIAEFYMMVTECTNEQYAEFVLTTGHRPPFEWAHPEDRNGARMAFLEGEQAKKQAAAKEGRTYKPEKFDEEHWWDRNWQDQRWELPADRERHPVGRVDYSDALAYCTWAGLRLPTEFEFQRAGRGDEKRLYPWGDAWEANKFAVTSEQRRSSSEPVASMPAGASEYGIYDLAGNHWEWTSSPYLPYPGYKTNKYKIDKSTKTIPANWDGNQRVVMGGSFQNGQLTARLTTRRPTDRTQLTNALGFRAAGTPSVAYDIGVSLDNQVVKPADLRNGVVFDPTISTGLDCWGSKASALPNGTKGLPDAPEGYAVITSYDYITFVPTEEIDAKSDTELEQNTLAEAQHLGFLATSMPILEPALDPGVYFISFRAKGKPVEPREKDPKSDQEADTSALDVSGVVDITKDNLLIFDAQTDELVHHFPVTGLKMEKPRNPSMMVWTKENIWEGTGEDKVQVEQDWLTVKAVVPTRLSSRAVTFDLGLRVSPEVRGTAWRQ